MAHALSSTDLIGRLYSSMNPYLERIHTDYSMKVQSNSGVINILQQLIDKPYSFIVVNTLRGEKSLYTLIRDRIVLK